MFFAGCSRNHLYKVLNLQFNVIGWEMAYDMHLKLCFISSLFSPGKTGLPC
jgi:hypothetical protein